MNCFKVLKRGFIFYIISGFIAALSFFSLLVLHRYNHHLSYVLDDMKSVGINKHKVRKEIEDVYALNEYFGHELNLDISGVNPERLIFRALDNMKTDLPDAGLSVSKLEEKGGTTELPVNIDALMKNYKMIVDYVEYIESFRIPAYKINNISISGNPAGGLMLHIKGSFVTPYPAG